MRTLCVASAVALAAMVLEVVDGKGATSAASSYGPGLYGNRMSCGGRLTPSTRAVAHRTLPCGTRVRICYALVCATARVRDRGPFVHGRTLDLSEAVVRSLGYRGAMTWGVRVVAWRVT